MKNKSVIRLLLILLVVFSIYIYEKSYSFVITNDRLKVSYIDVGQGDSIFIELPNSETILIDAGEREYASKVIKFINEKNYKKIDYVIGTHPHSDHIGGLQEVLSNLEYEEIILPKVSHTSNTYKNLLLKIKNDNKKISTAIKDKYIINNDELKVKILSPEDINYDNLNNYSVVIMINYKNTKFLFMGDAETMIEKELDDIKANVLKVGHHGSSSSSSKEFLHKVKPKYAIISCGKNNMYNLPNDEILDRLDNINAKVYRTDIDGTITMISDGINITIE